MYKYALHVIHDKFGPKPPTPTRRRPLSARARPRGGRRAPTSLHRPLIENARFPAAARPQPVRAPPRATPRGRFRAPHEPLHGRSLSGLAPRASTRTPHVSLCHYLTAKAPPSRPPSRSAARAEGRDLRPLHVPSRGELRTLLDTKRHSRKSLESMHETTVDFASSSPRSHILSEISPRSHSDLPESGNSYELLWSSTEVHMTPS